MRRRTVGILGENAACTSLTQNGFEILNRNWRTRFGEIDCIAVKGSKIHFVEIKTRRSNLLESFSPLNAIDRRKRKRIRQLAEYYLQKNKRVIESKKIASVSCDLAAVLYTGHGPTLRFEVFHLRGVY